MSALVDLETVPSSDLWNELKKRYRNCLLVYSANDKATSKGVNCMRWDGTLSEVLGLIAYAQFRAQDALDESDMVIQDDNGDIVEGRKPQGDKDDD